MPTRERVFYLLNRHITNTITPAESEELFSYISSSKNDPFLDEYINANLDKERLIKIDLAPQRAQEIFQKIINAEEQNSRIIPAVFRRKFITRWSVAASLMALIVLAAFSIIKLHQPGNDIRPDSAALLGSKLFEKTNNTPHPIKLTLEDGSVVTMAPGAVIKYPYQFALAKREVSMEGEIFFEISKNPNRPFFVYNNELITRVLGTSFNIKTDVIKKQVEVSVVTGRVQVYENAQAMNNHSGGAILTPNQKVIFNKTNRNFATTLVSNPVSIIPDNPAQKSQSFIFNETPLYTVLASIEKTYGIEMVVQNQTIYNYHFTGNITKYDLYAKLEMICESTKTSYEIIGTKILIKLQN